MSFFGNHLLEKDMISEENLVEALVTQSQQLPSAMEVCFEKKLLSPEQIIEVVNQQGSTESFISTCQRLGYWTNEAGNAVAETQKSSRQPIGQILLEKFNLDILSLGEELASSGDTNPASQGETTEINDLEDDSVSSFQFSFSKVSGETQRQYLDFFSSEIKDELVAGCSLLGEADFDSSKLYRLEELCQQLTAAASFARMEISFTLAQGLSSLLEGLTANDSPLPANRESLMKISLTAVDVLWELHRFIDISGSEEEFWNNAVSVKNFENIMTQLNSLVQEGVPS